MRISCVQPPESIPLPSPVWLVVASQRREDFRGYVLLIRFRSHWRRVQIENFQKLSPVQNWNLGLYHCCHLRHKLSGMKREHFTMANIRRLTYFTLLLVGEVLLLKAEFSSVP